ncbi:hypothetical protein QEZ40_000584 [Streptomyces katrae]|uniref:Uncharacterized protein n=1 Tax=Streptomyces katrae TaxID=68223 RepID=A0ABT7H5Z8_9ACTN|nr:hypothetical protein [Streptomyces katrae]MDK9501307.1 hypothetical protein [Streptomyces katrae]
MAEPLQGEAGGVGGAAPVRAAQLQQLLLRGVDEVVMSIRCSGGTVERQFVPEPPADFSLVCSRSRAAMLGGC